VKKIRFQILTHSIAIAMSISNELYSSIHLYIEKKKSVIYVESEPETNQMESLYLIPKVDNYKESNKEGLVGEQKYVSTNAYKYG